MSGFNKILIIVAIFVTYPSFRSFGQNYHFSNIHENLYLCNPASITQTKKLSIQATYRNQWPGNSDFVSYSTSFFFTSETLKSTGGILLLRDSQGEGIVTSSYYSILYGYRTKLAGNWFFSGGIQAAYTLYSANFSDQTFINNQTPNILLDEKTSSFDFSTGVSVAYGEIAKYGFSASKMGSLLPAQNTSQYLQLNISYEGKYLITKNHSFREYYVEPLVFLSLQNNFSEMLYGARLDYNSILGGLYFRQDLKFQYDAIIILLGTRFGKVAFFYSYDINLSGVDSRFTNLAAHEVTFLYNLEYKSETKKRGAIKCPKI